MAPETEYGVLAQLVERQVRNLKVRGSIPLCSTEEGRPDGLPSSVEHLLILPWSIFSSHHYSAARCSACAFAPAAGSTARFSATISLTLRRAADAARERSTGLPSSVEHPLITALRAAQPAPSLRLPAPLLRFSATISLTLHRAADAAAGGQTVSPFQIG